MGNAWLSDLFVRILKLDTPPVAVSLYPSREDLPRKPLPFAVNICQLMSMARHQGRAASGVPDRMVCSLGAACTGLLETPAPYRDGSAAVGRYVADAEAGRTFFANTFKLGDSGARFDAILISPLSEAGDDPPPDAVVFYASPAQVMRLVHSCTYHTGEKVEGSTVCEAAVCSAIGWVAGTGRPVIGIPCAGDRRFGGTQNHEMVFAAPFSMLEDMAGALETLSAAGPLFPVPPHVMYTPSMPQAYTVEAPAGPTRDDG